MTHLHSSYSFYNYSIIATQTAFNYRYSVYAIPFALIEQLVGYPASPRLVLDAMVPMHFRRQGL